MYRIERIQRQHKKKKINQKRNKNKKRKNKICTARCIIEIVSIMNESF